ncbi:alpha/beta hydrolase [Flagellimonas pacifica]|uniref:Alpha/beta hydrolase n=1 Tax=Flagellimonas pacifica TaxID=1247520 RepID=A0A285MTS3_9FLAO|nr:alpha/beta hydrolase-fold protein [Allomuricauda parva]SNY99937.1 hypothetical protein SAMN06265377_1752 [Allomuricauda parva]
MKTIKLSLLICLVSLSTVFAQENSSVKLEPSNLVLPRIQVIPLKDTQADRQYELYIKLPEGYSKDTNPKYPVLYTTDAMWHLEMLSGTTEYMLEDIILVGISWQLDINEDLKNERGAHVSRFRDYSINKHSNPEIQKKFQLGQANNHLDFFRNDVITYVDKTYRTDPNNRTYFGYSLGGLFGAYILQARPDTFKNYILGSPALEGDIPMLSKLDSKPITNHKVSKTNVFLSYGSLEKELGENAGEFIAILKNNNDGHLVLHREVIEGTHQTAFPLTVLRSVVWLLQIKD